MQFEAMLNGVHFRPIEAKTRVGAFEGGEALTLEREPYNEYDSNAIKVIDAETEIFIGYVAKEVAMEIAPLMDAGAGTLCKVGTRMSEKKWALEIEVEDHNAHEALNPESENNPHLDN